jgi:hypothetical protein
MIKMEATESACIVSQTNPVDCRSSRNIIVGEANSFLEQNYNNFSQTMMIFILSIDSTDDSRIGNVIKVKSPQHQ